MKKTISIVLVMTLALTCVGCGTTKTFTIDEFKSALINEEIEVDNFGVSQQDDGFSFNAAIDDEFILTGTADKNQMVNYVRFENIGLDTSVFSNNTIFEKWHSKAMNRDIGSMTMKELSRMIVALRCISELEAFFAVATEDNSEDGFLFAINTLLRKESSDIENWDVRVIVNNGDTVPFDEWSLVIEATYVK